MKFIYDKTKTHKAIYFGPGIGGTGKHRPKIALCKLARTDAGGGHESIDQKICKRNWKDVDCPYCLIIGKQNKEE